jgi:hydrogenase maturation factor HypF (carbamoyltransferase family)
MRPDENTSASDQKTDLLCDGCGQAFSAFLNEMAEHNAKVTACPKCGKHHDFDPPKAAKPAPRARSVKKTLKTI